MAYTLGNKCAKNCCKRTIPVQLIVEDVVTCFFVTQCSTIESATATIHKRYSFFCLPWGRSCGNHAKRCMNEKTIQGLPNASQHVPIYLQQFPSYSNRKCKKIAVFTYLNPHFFVSPGDAPAIITQYVAWMERQFNACQTLAACTYIFNSFRVIRCLTQCVSPKIAILPHICFPWEHPWGNHAKCSMDGKIIRCLQIVSLHVPSNYNRF